MVADPVLRTALVVTTMVGVTIGTQFLGLDARRDAPADRIAALLRPAFKVPTEPPRRIGARASGRQPPAPRHP
ncbi:hypothetical protein OG936_03575 [Streptomyces sp. NBC_00846]|uniref:hypothetical protein n=1 Tax=Streptomyces sp. NBC_00846 TaxID=2975849 RepID=UPI00386CEBE0|nr:hypothetical protein OG936_03575 [Streptomyces sp. NBC_00846]